MSDIRIFKRYEKKYLLTMDEYHKLQEALGDHLVKDEYFHSIVSNIYYDTPDYRLIRDSLDKPVYKEKLRLRSYKVISEDDNAYLELKKKYEGIVYKRREKLKYSEAGRLIENPDLKDDTQIARELGYFIRYYGELSPAIYLGYERDAYTLSPETGVRITFDYNALWRQEDISLTKGHYGRALFGEGQCLMEVKAPMAIPLYFVRLLEEMNIYPTSFSKYGTAYKTILAESLEEKTK